MSISTNMSTGRLAVSAIFYPKNGSRPFVVTAAADYDSVETVTSMFVNGILYSDKMLPFFPVPPVEPTATEEIARDLE